MVGYEQRQRRNGGAGFLFIVFECLLFIACSFVYLFTYVFPSLLLLFICFLFDNGTTWGVAVGFLHDSRLLINGSVWQSTMGPGLVAGGSPRK